MCHTGTKKKPYNSCYTAVNKVRQHKPKAGKISHHSKIEQKCK